MAEPWVSVDDDAKHPKGCKGLRLPIKRRIEHLLACAIPFSRDEEEDAA